MVMYRRTQVIFSSHAMFNVFFGLLVGFELVSFPFESQFGGLPLFIFCRGSFLLAALPAVQDYLFV